MESFQSQGFPLDSDMFTTGSTSHGCGHAPRTVWKGIRTTGADFITKSQLRENITVITGTTVDKVILERNVESEALRATGIAIISEAGEKSTVRARKEVIISAGTYCSPTILLRSGIGAKSEVEKFGITSLFDLPDVGKNLLDHLVSADMAQKTSSLILIFNRSCSSSTRPRKED